MAGTQLERRSAAVGALSERRADLDANNTVVSLCDGLDLIVDLFFSRIDRDVELNFGMDSMVMPPSTAGEVKASRRARTLIEVYSHVVAGEEAKDQQYINDAAWFENWLTGLRCDAPLDDSMRQRADRYRNMQPAERRLKFASSLERRLPQATHAPLVLYRLFPLAVRMAVAIAFGDNLRAGELRNKQTGFLPIIADCHECHGHPLDNGDRCSTCGSPIWSYDWLTAAD